MDGAYVLRKRPKTRLWYRAISGRMTVAARPAVDLLTTASDEDDLFAAEAAWAEILAEPLAIAPAPAPDIAAAPPTLPVRQVRRLGRSEMAAQQTAVLPSVVAASAAPTSIGGDWRIVPDAAPSLMLSATDLLDARNPGPVLRPGARYRIASVQNGVVGLHVAAVDGAVGLGYCAAVDLICIDARFNGHKPGRSFGEPATSFRSKVLRLTGGLSGAATSLLGVAASSHGSRLT
jgi:hypothetical protein